MKEWLVSDQTCKGCKYYSNLMPGSSHGGKCCDYTYITGRARKNKPAECEVKKMGKRITGYEKTIPMFNPKKKNTRGRSDG